MKTINLKVVIALILGSVTMAFTTPKTLDRDGKLPVTKERKNIFNYISREQIEIENRAVIEKMSPEARKKMAESFAKFQAKNKGNLCLYIFNECTANLNNYCKLNLMDKNNITHLNYSIPTNNSKLVRSATVYGCDVYYMYFDCETGFIFWIGLYPGWW